MTDTKSLRKPRFSELLKECPGKHEPVQNRGSLTNFARPKNFLALSSGSAKLKPCLAQAYQKIVFLISWIVNAAASRKMLNRSVTKI